MMGWTGAPGDRQEVGGESPLRCMKFSSEPMPLPPDTTMRAEVSSGRSAGETSASTNLSVPVSNRTDTFEGPPSRVGFPSVTGRQEVAKPEVRP